jgi:predicted HAD superfamily hydrolase
VKNKTVIHRFDSIESALTGNCSRAELFLDPRFQNLVVERLKVLIPENGVLSVDIFDTLILRDNSSELTRFIEIGNLMADILNRKRANSSQVKGIDCFMARQMGTQSSYRASTLVQGCREGSLTEIHRTASRLLTGSDEYTADFINAEIHYESKRIIVNNILLDIVKNFTQMGRRAILISDTYMHMYQIEALLKKLGVDISFFENMFSSADTKISKASGGIFALVEQELSACSSEFVHIGDNLKGDFKMPIFHGWKALHLPLSQHDIDTRRKDHMATAAAIKDTYGLTVNISIPS